MSFDLAQINEIIATVLKNRSLDRRVCYTSVTPLPPDGSQIRIECSDKEVLGEIEQNVRRKITAPVFEPGFVKIPELDWQLPEVFVTVTSVADVRQSPSHTSELVTQVIYGDVVDPLKQDGEWILVRVEDGYIGWIRSWYLQESSRREVDEFLRSSGHRIAATITQIFERPSEDALPISDAVIGIPVRANRCDKRGWRNVHLPDGKIGYAKARSIESRKQHRNVTRNSLSAIGLKFLGVPYLWGGNTPKGFDCSGLIQRIFSLCGPLLPRDSDMQAQFGKRKRSGQIDSLRMGDLLFFGKSSSQITHVAMYLSDSLFLHAYGQVRINSLLPQHPLYEDKLVREWRITRDPLVG
jgi:cell wall-associated NlpC family hydrolase